GDRFPRSPQEPESTSRRLYAGCRAGSKQVAPGDRFPRSPQEPESTSRRLYAGCRAGSKQVAPCAYPTGTTPPWF
ncbi:hypothetical protein, partial [Photorhabdus sp. CRCIA-P01]|uniref:hypothetical protein n=1 Tax=Photorhabdus sp. CRCIA-P01 TaxID=2019570 RepID=UPI00130099C1